MTFYKNLKNLFFINKNYYKISNAISVTKQPNLIRNFLKLNPSLIFKPNVNPSRYFSISLIRKQNNEDEPKRQNRNQRPLMLMDIPRILVPNIFELIKIRLKVKFRMLKIDPSFNYNEFSKGALQGVVTVSNFISRGDFDNLKNLVHDAAIEKIKNNYELLSQEQKNLIAVNPNDVQVQVHYMFEEADANTSKFVKMGLLFYVVPGFHDALQKTFFDPAQQFEMRKKFQQDLIVADYRFVREYENDNKSSWLITELNHWAIADYEEDLQKK